MSSSPPLRPVPRTNWSGNYRYSTDRVLEPATVAEVQAAVRSAESVRALGTRHCFNGIADSVGAQISTRRLCDVQIDAPAATARVGPGIRYGELAVQLDAAGFALHNLASLPHISVGGAVATGTHGSGLGNGNLATAVKAIEMVTADGRVRTLSRDSDPQLFAGSVVGLGALGIVTHLTLALQPSFQMLQTVYQDLPFAVLETNLEQIMGAAYSVSLFTDWQGGKVRQVWIKRRLQDGASAPAPSSFFGAILATTQLHPLPEQRAEACTEQGNSPGAWYERLPHFRLEFEPSHGEELQSEYFVPIEQGYPAIRAVETLRDRIAPLLYVTELRAIAADDLWLSGQYGRRSLAIHFTWRRSPEAVLRVLPAIEAALAPFAARPHWGKLFTMGAAHLRTLYPQLDEFAALRRSFDPTLRFGNAFLESVL